MRFPKLLVPIAGLVLLAGCRTAFDPAPAADHPRLANVPGIGPNRGPLLAPNARQMPALTEVRRMPADPPPAPSPLRRVPMTIEPRRMPADPPPAPSPIRRVPATIEPRRMPADPPPEPSPLRRVPATIELRRMDGGAS